MLVSTHRILMGCLLVIFLHLWMGTFLYTRIFLKYSISAFFAKPAMDRGNSSHRPLRAHLIPSIILMTSICTFSRLVHLLVNLNVACEELPLVVGSSQGKPFWLKLVRTTSCFCILLPGKTSQHATQEMDVNGYSQWLGPGSPWTSTEVEKWPVASSGRKQPTFNQQEPTRRQPAPRSNVRAPDPDGALVHARSKVSSLEAALTAMGSHQGPEVDALRSALQKAKQAAQERPLKVQLVGPDRCVRRKVTSAHQEFGGGTRSRGRAPQCGCAKAGQIARTGRSGGSHDGHQSGDHEPKRRNCTVKGQGGPVGGSLESSAAVFSGGSRSGEDEGRRFRPPRWMRCQ